MLLDVNLLLAYGWSDHSDHEAASAWMNGLAGFSLCPITELGFIRVSMSPAFRATHESAKTLVEYIKNRPGVEEIPCDISPVEMSSVTSYKDTTDSYLVALARQHQLQFATLDQGILNKPWAAGVAFYPL